MTTGILKEKKPENRVAITPGIVRQLTALKIRVIVEKGAGERATLSDKQYLAAGAETASKKEVLQKSDLILKVNPVEHDEVQALRENQVILAALNPYYNKEMVKSLAESKITSFSMELVPRNTRAQSMDILSSMATVAGYKAVLDAAVHLPRFFPMFMSAAGTVKPAKVLILGAGVAGLQALAISRKLGAVVEVFDVRAAVKEEVKSLGGKFIEVEGAVEDKNAGGYAVEQTNEFKNRQAALIHEHAVTSDVVICTAQIPGKKAPVLLKKNTIENMKTGSVVIDLAASTGGNCEVSENGKTVKHHNVQVIGKSDYPSDLAYDASAMFAKNIFNFLKLILTEEGSLNLNFDDEIVKGTCLTHKGEIMNEAVKATL